VQYCGAVLGSLLEDSLSDDVEALCDRYRNAFTREEIQRLMAQPEAVRLSLYAAWLKRPRSGSSGQYAKPTPRAPLPEYGASPWEEWAIRLLEDGVASAE
jgi:hypothetical protein